MAFPNLTSPTPLLLTYENESMYLHVDQQGCALFSGDSPNPFYRVQEPLLLAHGIMTAAQTVHLVILKTSGELCYTFMSGSTTPQTTLIAKLDVQATNYQRLFLFPQGKIIHIFYAHTHQAIRALWHIEHRYWDGSIWHSARLGEVVHPREPLYHVNLDSQGNLHLLTITFQGQHSLLYTNRFNGTFHLWGSPSEALKISGEVINSAALLTTDNVQHLFWIAKVSPRQFEIRWAQQTDAHELNSQWHPSPAPIKTFSAPWKNIGALEINGVLWLLAHSEDELLMQNDGKGWKLISSHTPIHRPLKWVHKGKRHFQQTYWLEDQVRRRAPAYYHELDFALNKDIPLVSAPGFSPTPMPIQSIPPAPPIPAYYPNQASPVTPSSTSPPFLETASLSSLRTVERKTPGTQELLEPLAPDTATVTSEPLETARPSAPSEISETSKAQEAPAFPDIPKTSILPKIPELPESSKTPETPKTSEISEILEVPEALDILTPPEPPEPSPPPKPTETDQPPPPAKENPELERLISTVAHLEQENINLRYDLQNMFAKFEQILEAVSANASPAQESDSQSSLLEEMEAEPVQSVMSASIIEPDMIMTAMTDLEKETESLSQVLRVMMTKQEQFDSSIENLTNQISQLQEEKKDKGGFWSKWIT